MPNEIVWKKNLLDPSHSILMKHAQKSRLFYWDISTEISI